MTSWCHAATAQTRTSAALCELRREHPGLRLILSIGGRERAPQCSDVAITPGSGGRFAASCIQAFLVWRGFDGIDVGWEFPVHGGMSHPRPADATALVRMFRHRLEARGRKNHHHYYLTSYPGRRVAAGRRPPGKRQL